MLFRIDLTGKRFNQLVCLKAVGQCKDGRTLWLCKCDCGNEHIANVSNLRRGHTQSCGCLGKHNRGKTHGLSMDSNGHKTRLYNVWIQMRQRCLNKHHVQRPRYGGRGIIICKEWNNYKVFHNWAMSNNYRDDLTIERINNDGNYEPVNCRWATLKEQARNTCRNRLITFQNKTKCLAEWARKLGANYDMLRGRLDRGWPVARAFTEPVLIKN